MCSPSPGLFKEFFENSRMALSMLLSFTQFRKFALCTNAQNNLAFSGLLTGEDQKAPNPLTKICDTSYNDETWYSYILPKEGPNMSHVTHLEFCWHQHFFTGYYQILLYQEIQT